MSATTDSNTDTLENAEEIIDRFGGIRPMASKMSVAVTTVQGWKKRKVIPGNRRGAVLEAARENGIDLSDLVSAAGANQNVQKKEEPVSSGSSEEDSDKTAAKTHESVPAPEGHIRTFRTGERPPEEPSVKIAEGEAVRKFAQEKPVLTNEDLIRQMHAAQSMSFNKSAWFTVGFVFFAVLIGAVALWPTKQQIERNTDSVTELRSDVQGLHDSRRSFLENVLPDDLDERIANMQEKAETLQDTVNTLSSRVETIAEDVLAPGATVGERLQNLETHASALGAPVQMIALLHKVQELQGSAQGQAQFSQIMQELTALMNGAAQEGVPFDEALAQTQQGDGALGETLQGLSGDDLKAAALLLGLSQFRSSLNRSEPFGDDLALLQKLLGDKDPALQDALDKLAPKAESGVLTPDGLKDQFRGLAGDIVVASLQGEDVSVQEKARARLNDILKVEHNGELITGTDTQATVAKAQKLLDQGDIEGAMAVLKSLDGEAAETAQPFMTQAEYTLLAQKAQGLLTSQVIGSVKSALPDAGAVSVEQLIREIKKMAGVPQPIRY